MADARRPFVGCTCAAACSSELGVQDDGLVLPLLVVLVVWVLYVSDLLVALPPEMYSGAVYPLHNSTTV